MYPETCYEAWDGLDHVILLNDGITGITSCLTDLELLHLVMD